MVSGKGDVGAGLVFKAQPQSPGLNQIAIDIYPESQKKNMLFSNRDNPLSFGGQFPCEPKAILAKIESTDFDENEIYILDLTVDG